MPPPRAGGTVGFRKKPRWDTTDSARSCRPRWPPRCDCTSHSRPRPGLTSSRGQELRRRRPTRLCGVPVERVFPARRPAIGHVAGTASRTRQPRCLPSASWWRGFRPRAQAAEGRPAVDSACCNMDVPAYGRSCMSADQSPSWRNTAAMPRSEEGRPRPPAAPSAANRSSSKSQAKQASAPGGHSAGVRSSSGSCDRCCNEVADSPCVSSVRAVGLTRPF